MSARYIFIVMVSMLLLTKAENYKSYESVHLTIKCGGNIYEAPRMSSPKFAVDNTVTLPLSEVCGQDAWSDAMMEMIFDHGTLTIPRFEAGRIKAMDVTFYHSHGFIHSLSNEEVGASSTNNAEQAIKINFFWQEEGDEDATGGLEAMIFFSFAIVLLLLFRIGVGFDILNPSSDFLEKKSPYDQVTASKYN